MMKRTTIMVYQDTKDELAKLGLFGESYDHLLNRLIDDYQKRSRKK